MQLLWTPSVETPTCKGRFTPRRAAGLLLFEHARRGAAQYLYGHAAAAHLRLLRQLFRRVDPAGRGWVQFEPEVALLVQVVLQSRGGGQAVQPLHHGFQGAAYQRRIL